MTKSNGVVVRCVVCTELAGTMFASTDVVPLCPPHAHEFEASREWPRFDHFMQAGKWRIARVALGDWLRRMDRERRVERERALVERAREGRS